MQKNLTERTLALAGLFQACAAVRHVAQEGKSLNDAVTTAIESLLKQDASSAEDVYGGVFHLQDGLQTLINQLDSDTRQRDVELTRYAVSVLYLERKLSKQSAMLATIGQGIEEANQQADYFAPTHENVIARLADLYQQTISQLRPRILVSGDPAILANPDNAALIRSLLFSAIRSAVLWRQAGGSRWQLLFKRRAIVTEARQLLARISSQVPDSIG